MVRHFLSAADFSCDEVETLLAHARTLKHEWSQGIHRRTPTGALPLQTQTLALVFEKPSLRTRVAFEAGMHQLGGHASYLSANDIDMGGREQVSDVAHNLSRWVAAIAARVFKHTTVETLARYATVPVINALSDEEHPCQALADMLTIQEHRGTLAGLKLAFIGDGNNVCHSLILLGSILGLHIVVACPSDYQPHPDKVAHGHQLAEEHGGTLTITAVPHDAAEDADVIYTDVWASMGHEHEAVRRRHAFAPYQVTRELVGLARPDALVMHCLPAHRGEEIAADVIDGPQSVVFDQAENRLHVQKALVLTLLKNPCLVPLEEER